MEIQDLIIDDRDRGIFRVHRSCMTSLDLFQREHELIFNRCWIYLGHESEVESPGDYRRRTVAGQPLFFVRSKDGQVRVFLNSCPHRGAMICRHDEGNAKTLQCFYHAWSFNTSGELVAVPGRDAYGPHFDPGEHGLKAPPRVDNYRGFLFVSFNPDVEDLVTYLAEARDYLDLVVDQAEKGMRVISGSNKYAIKANWKLLAENSLDGYHLVPTHRTYVDYITGLGTDDSGESLAARPPGAGRALGNGHCVSENISRNGRPIARWHPVFGEEAKPRIEKVRRRLAQKYGEERAYRMADTSRNLLIYPNLLIMDFVAISIRYIEPLAPDRMEVTAWHLVPREESGAALATRLDSYLTFLGPGGFATPDDVEALESCQTGFRASGAEWSDISRGMLKPNPGTADELQMRGFWRQWHANMQGLNQANVQDGQPPQSRHAVDSETHEGGHLRNGER
ncbi:MAG: Rieske 2Fe-2S domain-containing protein [Gammaproteobacteria bacterium]|nr:Rieske 2Fe-2S domain-containing protein [Gammaproteobacteria bacterium]MXZ33621.1 Rieske 2Fe-2S domain-containing protein [Gammaproteobacteria bacterium]MYE98798.1 Rieske 2Fe-2S domain-containing protein [Gammaproteobacteria bacterium]MYG95577.1 Rieske 2Fe-2S domain-containing protein [Gammaproteobacteria bacterium]